MPTPLVELLCGSRSSSRTDLPRLPRDAARFTAVVVLPTPPFWFATAMTRPTSTSPWRLAGALPQAMANRKFHVKQSTACVRFSPLVRTRPLHEAPRLGDDTTASRLFRSPRYPFGPWVLCASTAVARRFRERVAQRFRDLAQRPPC